MNIYIGNLCLETTEGELRRLFFPFGDVSNVAMMDDQHFGSGQSRGYAYLDMPSRTEAEVAIDNLNGTIFKRRTVSVIQALPLSRNHSKSSKSRYRNRPSA